MADEGSTFFTHFSFGKLRITSPYYISSSLKPPATTFNAIFCKIKPTNGHGE
jgi:hypothetical protein